MAFKRARRLLKWLIVLSVIIFIAVSILVLSYDAYKTDEKLIEYFQDHHLSVDVKHIPSNDHSG